ncbi:hypothetical protein [Clostridium mediterraneense]|uniref:hypothetical protein n=1 Tax=Clostridium mediterraneense TaxID=1805472 RepID=UPI0013564D22|nr:hypothetical protein [Clostridium mediterraneense]
MIGNIKRSGMLCSVNGMWKVQGTPSTTVRAKEGDVMPRFRGKDVSWRMIQHLPR